MCSISDEISYFIFGTNLILGIFLFSMTIKHLRRKSKQNKMYLDYRRPPPIYKVYPYKKL